MKTVILTIAATLAPATLQAEDAVYVVPPGEALAEAVEVELARASFSRRGDDRIRLAYRLPKALDGSEPRRLRLEGAAASDGGEMSLSGAGADAVCLETEEQVECHVSYEKDDNGLFPLQHDAAEAYLESREDLTQAEIERLRGARLNLAHEALGIVRIRK